MLASLQSFGRSPVSIDTLKIFCNIGASWTAHSLSILLGILSGPDDFDGLTFDSNFSSPSYFMIIGLILFLHCIFVDGKVVSVVWVNTDMNCWRRRFAFPLLSLINCVPFFSGTMYLCSQTLPSLDGVYILFGMLYSLSIYCVSLLAYRACPLFKWHYTTGVLVFLFYVAPEGFCAVVLKSFYDVCIYVVRLCVLLFSSPSMMFVFM